MLWSPKSSRKKILCRHCCFRRHSWSSPGKYNIMVLFISLIVVKLLFIVFPFHVYFFVLVYFFVGIFTRSHPATKTVSTESQPISIPSPPISLLQYASQIFTSRILLLTLHLLRDVTYLLTISFCFWRNCCWHSCPNSDLTIPARKCHSYYRLCWHRSSPDSVGEV